MASKHKGRPAIIAAREKQRLSQARLASALGVEGSTVFRWERGRAQPSEENLVALAALLKVRLSWLREEFAKPPVG